MEDLIYNITFIGKGIFITAQILFGGIIIGFILGLTMSIARYVGIAKFLTIQIISIIRGTPLILQLSLVYFTTPLLLGFSFNIVTTGIITFGINSSAYIAEIIRAGIESIPKGQFEAAQTLQIPNYYIWRDIILPQVARNIFPAMINEIVSLLKETALISTIGGMDIMRAAQTIAAAQFTYFAPLCIAGVYYYIIVLFIEYIGKKIEKKVQNVKN
ncbi:amino acid ABC transporter permease [Anaplasmataceae bacterium AB001_6]|nr:amino acid ABC transporter permease [Anaplasmataceae bacterium AB001_6]